MPTLELTKGHTTTVSEEDYEYLSQWKWTFDRYAYRTKSTQREKRPLRMHRVIMERMLGSAIPKGYDVDHIDGDKLNNIRSNLRLATRSQNLMNGPGKRESTSHYKGVCWFARNKKWLAQIKIGSKQLYIGLFEDEKEAALAYDRIARKEFGEFAYLNFPDE